MKKAKEEEEKKRKREKEIQDKKKKDEVKNRMMETMQNKVHPIELMRNN